MAGVGIKGITHLSHILVAHRETIPAIEVKLIGGKKAGEFH